MSATPVLDLKTCPMPLILIIICVAEFLIAIALILQYRKIASVSVTARPAMSAVPGRGPEPVHLRTLGPSDAEQTWKQQQFLDEFEAQVAATYLDKDSQELLKRAQGRYLNEDVQAMWELWARAVSLTQARLRKEQNM